MSESFGCRKKPVASVPLFELLSFGILNVTRWDWVGFQPEFYELLSGAVVLREFVRLILFLRRGNSPDFNPFDISRSC